MRRPHLLLTLLAASAALAGDAATLPDKLTPHPGKVSLLLELDTSWSSKDHKLRFMDDSAKLEAKLDVSTEGASVEARPSSLAVTRRKRAKITGIFSDTDEDAQGRALWSAGQPDAPPPWRMVVAPNGAAVADVGSAAPLWHLEAWLAGKDRANDEEARLRRLVHYLDVGFLGAPVLAPGERFEQSLVLELGESGLTNKLVLVEAVFALAVSRKGGLLEVAGPLARVKLLRGEGPDGRVDQWLDEAFARGGPDAKGELDATFDPAKGAWRSVKSRIALEHAGRFDGGSGRARFERTLSAVWE